MHSPMRSPSCSLRSALRAGALAALLGVALATGGCGGPKFPNCDNDQHCTTDGHSGVCVAGRCVECRDSAACGAGRECTAGSCVAIEGYCDEARGCAAGQTCAANHRCQGLEEAPKVAVECDDNHPCASGQCQNGHCVAPPRGGPGCEDFPAPKFDYEQFSLRDDFKTTLERLARCVTTGSLKGRRLLLTGHCDPRGEGEFNMALGAHRAETVKTFLVGLGVPTAQVATSSRGKLDASGSDDVSWANDRRVDIEVR